ncbi:MAG: hypothetical protein EBU46_11185 [Nitrosomonadaceae bacterium]|nr:hypothetical protein [Nitrosomonadaceae bacterium]
MINLQPVAEEYLAKTKFEAERARGALLDYARRRGYEIHQPELHTCHGGNSHLNFNLRAHDEPTYWFEVDCYAGNLRYFESRRSSHRGHIRVRTPGFDAFLDEMDKRKAEWLKKGKPLAIR